MAEPSTPDAGPDHAPPSLPPGWIAQWDAKSRKYYFVQISTGESTWDVPQMAAPNVPTPGSTPAGQSPFPNPDESSRGVGGQEGDRSLSSSLLNSVLGGNKQSSGGLGGLASSVLGGGSHSSSNQGHGSSSGLGGIASSFLGGSSHGGSGSGGQHGSSGGLGGMASSFLGGSSTHGSSGQSGSSGHSSGGLGGLMDHILAKHRQRLTNLQGSKEDINHNLEATILPGISKRRSTSSKLKIPMDSSLDTSKDSATTHRSNMVSNRIMAKRHRISKLVAMEAHLQANNQRHKISTASNSKADTINSRRRQTNTKVVMELPAMISKADTGRTKTTAGSNRIHLHHSTEAHNTELLMTRVDIRLTAHLSSKAMAAAAAMEANINHHRQILAGDRIVNDGMCCILHMEGI
ncbi:uncharacterized protein MYCFIDRAFT_89114 [Pseudocercospora fijiensis CIRAD86]|uniref:WW domain-containing protein n=1 Tax=Pseudocercospora fijiensis (strain CIRAD86) TaxID=383855 RepID=M3AP66_PSEFD|nr:uncharacterized protein MYCFIDRAFT_89114 [Pseudocercospora fijiensis CIRAD86]EME86391.1 hypothetical protein MYCFIDRAFT_89114 [Pseudocercospora fijiensis CIRAD86]